MPVPRCGRIGCQMGRLNLPHGHRDWAPGDRVVLVVGSRTAPSAAYRNAPGVVATPAEGTPAPRWDGSYPIQLDDDSGALAWVHPQHLRREAAFQARPPQTGGRTRSQERPRVSSQWGEERPLFDTDSTDP